MPGRIDRLGDLLAPFTRLVWGMGLIPLISLQRHWPATLACAAAAAGLAMLAGKRLKFGYFAGMVASVAAFNLFTPSGLVLLQLGPLTITQGALEDGLNKGLAICGLVFVSLASVSRELRFRGRFGELLARCFWYYERLLSERKQLRLRGLLISIDRLLERSFDPSQAEALPPAGPPRPSGPAGLALVAASWAGGLALLILA